MWYDWYMRGEKVANASGGVLEDEGYRGSVSLTVDEPRDTQQVAIFQQRVHNGCVTGMVLEIASLLTAGQSLSGTQGMAPHTFCPPP